LRWLIALNVIQNIFCIPFLTTRSKRETDNKSQLIISSFHVNTNIQFRYARTIVTSVIKNPGSEALEADFMMAIPESSFISNFSMIIKGTEYVSEVKEAEEAEEQYDHALNNGQGAGLVSRESENFRVKSSIEPGDKVVFKLIYDKLLDRSEGQYEYSLDINPGQVVEDFKVEVNIHESLPLSKLEVPELIESNETETQNSIAQITRNVDNSPNNAKVVFSPDEQYLLLLGEQGLFGKFVVRYDVDRSDQIADSEVQVIDGFFVHYFVPEAQQVLPKHVIFVLDTSGSMGGEKLEQMKDSMFTVLDEAAEKDYFNIIEFNSQVKFWSPLMGFRGSNSEEYFQADSDNKKMAIKSVLELVAGGGTNINEALMKAIELGKGAIRSEKIPEVAQSMIVFLTDGEATAGLVNQELIRRNIEEANKDANIAIMTIGFGRDADFDLLKKISQSNNGIAKRIYEGADAALQLENFFIKISNPVLSNVKFDYVGAKVDEENFSNRQLGTLFQGSEYIIVGQLNDVVDDDDGHITVTIKADGVEGHYHKSFDICLSSAAEVEAKSNTILFDPPSCLPPKSYPPRSDAQKFLKKLYAFRTIEQLLKQIEITEDVEEMKIMKQRALKLSLENNFVTQLTSLVVIKPNEDPTITDLDGNPSETPSLPTSCIPFCVGNPTASTIGVFGGGLASVFSPVLTTQSIVGGQNSAFGASASQNNAGGAVNQNCFGGHCGIGGFGLQSLLNSASVSHSHLSPFEISSTVTATTAPSQCFGSLTLYSKTFLRGDQFETDFDVEDLGAFDDEAVSAKISGNCCWEIFFEKMFKGESIVLKPSKTYTSATSFGKLLQNVSSIKKLPAC